MSTPTETTDPRHQLLADLGDLVLSYSEGELALIEHLLDRRIAGAPTQELLSLEGPVRERLFEQLSAVLIARGIIVPSPEEDRSEIRQPHASLLEVITNPRILASVQRQRGSTVESRWFYGEPVFSVEHSMELPRVHGFRFLPSAELVDRLVAFAALEERPVAPRGPVRLPEEQLARIASPSAPLSDDEVPEDARAFRAAVLAGGGAVVNLRCLRLAGERYEGVDLMWVDGGEHGLWLLEGDADEEAADPVGEARPVSAAELREQFEAVVVAVED
jgi:hypothetical protein